MAGNNVRQECLARIRSTREQYEPCTRLKVGLADFAERIHQTIGQGSGASGVILGAMGLVRGFEKCECACRIIN